jgi:DNA repair protein RadC
MDLIGLQEQFLVLYLNRNSSCIGVYKHSIGGINGTVVDLRIILGTGLKAGCNSIILSHNHPSGNLSPSSHDIQITKKIYEAARIMDISLADHLILDKDFNYYSFADNNLI